MSDVDQDQDQDQAGKPSAEQAAELAALEASAAPAAAAPGAAKDDALPMPSAQAMAYAAMVVRAVRALGGHLSPALRSAPDELWGPAVEGTAAVLEHYGIGAEDAKTHWGRFAVGVMPLAGLVAVERLTAPPKPDQVDQANQAGAGPARIGGPDLSAAAPRDQVAGSNTVTIGAPIA